MIANNTIVTFEVLHRMRNKRIRKKGQVAIKLDFSKAYGYVEWEFLHQIMLKLGIDDQWVCLAIETVHIASYLVLINGEPKGYITPSIGIKQGDPLSPYLFLLCAEGLSSLIRKAVVTAITLNFILHKWGLYISLLTSYLLPMSGN